MEPKNETFFTEYDAYLFHQGTNYEAYRKLGAHPCVENGVDGTRFAVWAPRAHAVSVLTAKTGWENAKPLGRSAHDASVWEGFLPGVGVGDAYRFVVVGADGGKRYKSDPYAFRAEKRPANASIVCALDSYTWHDDAYQAGRDNRTVLPRPMAIYEVHLAAWKKK